MKPSRGHRKWVAIAAVVLLAGWLISAGIAAAVFGLLFPDGFLIDLPP